MIDLVRRTPHAFDSVKRHEWNRDAFLGHNLYGQTLGAVGMGRLGSWMARYGEAFEMRVQFFDSYIKKSPSKKYKKVSFETLLQTSDCISIHVHLDKNTEEMFDTKAFARMKKNAYLINTARGKIVDEEALLAALRRKDIGGYATDVLAGETSFSSEGGLAFGGGWGVKKHLFVEYTKTHDNCIITPHIGGMMEESRVATDVFMAKKVCAFLKRQN